MKVNPMNVPFEPVLAASTTKNRALLEIEESKYYIGANIHAATSALWVQFAIGNSDYSD
jgi:hypothetical protein